MIYKRVIITSIPHVGVWHGGSGDQPDQPQWSRWQRGHQPILQILKQTQKTEQDFSPLAATEPLSFVT